MRSAADAWWDMPGPQRFVSSVAADLAAGRHVVVGLPPHTPPHLLTHLKNHFQPRLDARSWQAPPPPQLAENQSPAEWMWSYWKQGQADLCPFDLTPQDLARRTDLPVGKRVILTNMLPADWPKWWEFLASYAQQAQHTNALRRTLFCILVEDPEILTRLPTTQESQYRIHRYDGSCSRLDMQLYVAAHHAIAAGEAPISLVEEIRYELAALLFRTDPDAALQVAALAKPEVFALQALVKDVAANRQWPAAVPKPAASSDQEWAYGWIDQRHARAWRHPGAPHAIVPLQRAKMALWQAQVRVLLPWIEQRRRELVCEPLISTFLKGKLPHTFDRSYWKGSQDDLTYTKEQVDSLELGFIIDLFNKQTSLDAILKSNKRKFRSLKDARDKLSHLKSLSWQEVDTLLSI